MGSGALLTVQYHQTRDSYLVTMQVLSNYKASYDTVNIKLTVQGSYTIQLSIIKLRLFMDNSFADIQNVVYTGYTIPRSTGRNQK